MLNFFKKEKEIAGVVDHTNLKAESNPVILIHTSLI